MFAKWREVRRLRRENGQLKSEVARLRSELRFAEKFTLEQNLLFTDRFLTAITKTHAISDEAKSRAQAKPEDIAARKQTALEDFLQEKRDILREWAEADGLTGSNLESTVNLHFRQNEDAYRAEFEFNYS